MLHLVRDVPDVQATARRLVEAVADRLIDDYWWIVSPKPELPVNPTPGFIAAWMRLAMTANPAKYAAVFLPGQYAATLRLSAAVEMKVSDKFADSYYPNVSSLLPHGRRCRG